MPAIMLRYLPQILGALFVTGVLIYVYNKIDSGGYNRAVAECEKHNSEIERQESELLKLRQHERKIEKESQDKRTMGAIEEYAKYADDLRNDNAVKQLELDRVQNSTRKSEGNRNTMPRTDKGSCPPVRTSEEVIQNALSIKAAEMLIEKFLVPNAEIMK